MIKVKACPGMRQRMPDGTVVSDESYVEVPLDTFTRRRLADGSLIEEPQEVEAAENTQAVSTEDGADE